MPRKISKKRARYLEKRGEYVYKGIDGQWLWSGTKFKEITCIAYDEYTPAMQELYLRGRCGKTDELIEDIKRRFSRTSATFNPLNLKTEDRRRYLEGEFVNLDTLLGRPVVYDDSVKTTPVVFGDYSELEARVIANRKCKHTPAHKPRY